MNTSMRSSRLAVQVKNVSRKQSSLPVVNKACPLSALSRDRASVPSRGSRQMSLSVSAVLMDPMPIVSSEVAMGEGDRRLQTQTTQIAKDTTTIRSLDWDRDRFDIEFGLQEGTTYNSFIIKGDKTALIDASHQKFKQLYMDALSGAVDPSSIDYIIVSHTEPDHSGLVQSVLELCPNATVIGSKVCITFLENLVHIPFERKIVKNGEKLDLGGGHELEFILAPNLHWPDTIFTYDHGTDMMFTCDAFGMHYCSEEVFDSDFEPLRGHFSFYYDCLMRPNAKSVLTAMRKAKELIPKTATICTGHGPLLKVHLPEILESYSSWSTEATAKLPVSCGVFYTEGYGYSDTLAEMLARGIAKTEVETETINMAALDTQELIEEIGRFNGVVLMSPPADSSTSAMVGTMVASVSKKQKLLIAESYGGNDEPVDSMAMDFAKQEVEMPVDPLKVTDTPSEITYQLFEESGTDLGQSLTLKQSIEKKKTGIDAGLAKALGKISGGLYVVTASKGTAKSAMIASWISQASFEPLGFTVAVAHDRAIEAFMQVGDTFVLNCLKEDDYKDLMKHFLKRFPPGADRFEGIDCHDGENGSPILNAGAAYMECKVVSRLEAVDHWIVYSEVTAGNVSGDTRTAVHSRKVGTYY